MKGVIQEEKGSNEKEDEVVESQEGRRREE